MKPESVAVTMDGEQNVPNATESDNLMNESHTTEKEVMEKSINPLGRRDVPDNGYGKQNNKKTPMISFTNSS